MITPVDASLNDLMLMPAANEGDKAKAVAVYRPRVPAGLVNATLGNRFLFAMAQSGANLDRMKQLKPVFKLFDFFDGLMHEQVKGFAKAGVEIEKLSKSLDRFSRAVAPQAEQNLDREIESWEEMQEQIGLMPELVVRKELKELKALGIGSFAELRERQTKIALAKGEAGMKFYGNPKNIALAISADEAMVRAKTGKVEQRHQSTIHKYWKVISEDPKGYKLHEDTVERLGMTFMELIVDQSQKILQDLKQAAEQNQSASVIDSRLQVAEQFSKRIYEGFNTKYEQLLKEREALSDKEKVLLDYLLLQAHLIVPTLINDTIRRTVEPMAALHEDFISRFTERFTIPDAQRWIELYEQFLKMEENDRSDYESLKKDPALKKDIEELEEHHAKEHKFNIEQLAKYREILQDPVGHSKRLEGDPAKIRKLVPVDTAYERCVRDCFRLGQQKSAIQNPSGTDAESILDTIQIYDQETCAALTQPLSVSEHMLQMESELQRKLSLFVKCYMNQR